MKVGHTGRNTLDTATARQTADGGLGDALDVVAQDLAMALGAALAEALAALAACREDALACWIDRPEWVVDTRRARCNANAMPMSCRHRVRDPTQ